MRVLAFASQKSGAGKTTLAGHMAIQAQRAGMTPVVLVDVDPDASLTDWFALREEEDDAITVARSSLAGLPTKLQELRADGVELVVIDTPPALHHSIDEPIIAADLVAIPTRPCAHDLAAAGATVEMVQSHGKPFVFVVNGATLLLLLASRLLLFQPTRLRGRGRLRRPPLLRPPQRRADEVGQLALGVGTIATLIAREP